MAINVADNFSYKGGKPLDNRTKYSTIASMVATPAADLYDGCLAYVTSTKKNYQYDSTNTVDENLGKWRELQTGGSGEGIPAGGTTGQVLAKKTGTDYDVEWVNDQTADTSKSYKYDDNVANTIQDEDYFPYYNVSMSAKQQSTWTNIKSDLKTFFDQYYSGGGGGTSNYNDLTNKPQIAGIELSGNKLLNQFGLTDQVETQSALSIDRNIKSYVTRGEKYDWNTAATWYGTCTTSASTTAKSVTLGRGTLNFVAGAKIAVKFSYNNTASAPTLTINSTTKNIKYVDADGNVSTPLIWWNAGDIVEFTYDGTQWLMQPTMQMLFSGQGTKIPRESIYSTTEKVVGCWTDGRPVYQKTIPYTMPTVASEGTRTLGSYVAIGASVRDVIDINTIINSSYAYDTFNYVDKKGDRYVRMCALSNSASSNKNSLLAVSSDTSFNGLTAYVTIKYTKTTDSANSFNYGDPNDYSTTEKIVGSWIDGKPLYQKTINTGALPNNTTKIVAHNASSVKRIISAEGYAYNSNSGNSKPIMFVGTDSNNNLGVRILISDTHITIGSVGDNSAFTESYVTIKYTKTTG